MSAKTEIFIKIAALQWMPENSRHFIKCQTETRYLVKSVPKCLSTLVARHCMECPSTSRHFPDHSIKRLLADAGGSGRCHIIVKPTGIVRYLVDHLTAECCTSRFYNYAFATFLCCIVCATMVPLEWNRAPKLSFPCSHFMKKMQLRASPFYLLVHGSDMWQQLVHSTRAFRHLHLLAVHCLEIARHAHCCIPYPPNRDCSRNASLSARWSVPTALTSPLFIFPRGEAFCCIKALSTHSGYGM